METDITTYEQAVEYIENIPRFTGKNDVHDTKEFLRFLSHPERKLKVIHVAGTNGKGSVCAYLCSLLKEAGYSVGTFISPHLITMAERIRMNGIPVKREEFLNTFTKILDAVGRKKQLDESCGLPADYHPAYFEMLFFMALMIFDEKKPDFVILETGLGGRLDATNCVEKPLVSVITRIGMDHMQYLGNTLEEIAGEKAGILKPGVPVVYDDSVETASRIIRAAAKPVGAACYPVSKKDYTLLNFNNKTIDFSCFSRYYGYIRLCLDTTAFYQLGNAALALRTAELLLDKDILTREVIWRGIHKTRWEGRMEQVADGVWVDGAHNEDGVEAFLYSVARDGCSGERYLIFGAVQDKAYEAMVRRITDSRLFCRVGAVGMKSDRALSQDALKDTFAGSTQEVSAFPDVSRAYEAFRKKRKAADRIYAAGSLYLVGELKGYLRMRGSHD